jgi:hypothetical protein
MKPHKPPKSTSRRPALSQKRRTPFVDDEPHARGRPDDGNAFIPDPEGGPARASDDLAESLAEEYLNSATRGNETAEEALDDVVPEEIGGPFVETSAAEEFADDTDEANPPDAEVEPLPRPVAGLVQPADEEEEAEAEEEGRGVDRR